MPVYVMVTWCGLDQMLPSLYLHQWEVPFRYIIVCIIGGRGGAMGLQPHLISRLSHKILIFTIEIFPSQSISPTWFGQLLCHWCVLSMHRPVVGNSYISKSWWSQACSWIETCKLSGPYLYIAGERPKTITSSDCCEDCLADCVILTSLVWAHICTVCVSV